MKRKALITARTESEFVSKLGRALANEAHITVITLLSSILFAHSSSTILQLQFEKNSNRKKGRRNESPKRLNKFRSFFFLTPLTTVLYFDIM